MKGIVFDIKEFALNDGPGIRTTVFMKGCPLRCKWCHNPEGLLPTPQLIISASGRRLAGKEYEPDTLAHILQKNADVFSDTRGGITFSGGEPLMQADFLMKVLPLLHGIHVLLDTSGYADPSVFIDVVSRVQQVYFDLKIIDLEQHVRWTGRPNEGILRNLSQLDTMGIPYTVRVPLIPSVTDTRRNLEQIAKTVLPLKKLDEVNLLPYNSLAGAKYKSVGMEYEIRYNHGAEQGQLPLDVFSAVGVPVRVLTAALSKTEVS